MKRLGLFLFTLFACVVSAAPQMELGVFINNSNTPLAAATMSAPAVLDWNNDSRKDLLVGDSSGYVWLYLNQGTDANPMFNNGTRLMSGGSYIITDSGG